MPDTLRKTFGVALIVFFLLGLLPLGSGSRPAEALAKKKVVHKAKKVVRKVKKPVLKAKKKIIVKKKVTRVVKPKKAVARPEAYQLPARSGTVSQTYALKEKLDEARAGNVVSELKSIGVDEASVNVSKNSVQVKFNTRELSSIGIIQKLKELGYTVRRIN